MTRIAGLLADPMNTAGITSRWMSYLRQVDAGLAAQVLSTHSCAHPHLSAGHTTAGASKGQISGALSASQRCESLP